MTISRAGVYGKSDNTSISVKGIVQWHLNGIQDVGVFISTVVSILIFVSQSYNGSLWSPPQRACTEKSKLKDS